MTRVGKKRKWKRRCREKLSITEGRVKNLLLKALQGSSSAYKKLGYLFLEKSSGNKDRELGRLFLLEAVKMGDEDAYFLYHRIFSRGKQVIDDPSYLQCLKEYQSTKNFCEKQRLKRYLLLGTARQRKMGGNKKPVSGKGCGILVASSTV